MLADAKTKMEIIRMQMLKTNQGVSNGTDGVFLTVFVAAHAFLVISAPFHAQCNSNNGMAMSSVCSDSNVVSRIGIWSGGFFSPALSPDFCGPPASAGPTGCNFYVDFSTFLDSQTVFVLYVG